MRPALPSDARRGRIVKVSGALRVHAPAIASLSRAMNAHDSQTHQHAQRVQGYASVLAGEIGITDRRLLETLDAAALLHDIGKLAIPESLLGKSGPLTRNEYDRLKQHATIGADILSAASLPDPLALIVRHHHEHWDGSGYPDRLRGSGIPIAARVLSIVDAYDALTSDRPYRGRLSPEDGATMIRQGRGSLYDPHMTDAFLRIAHCLRAVALPRRPAQRAERVRASWLREAHAL